jgi:hypothetical protein
MKKLIFISFCIPFFVIGQSKKELKMIVVQYQDKITDLNSIIESHEEESIKREASESILQSKFFDLDIKITELKNEKKSLTRENNNLLADNEVSLKKEEKSKNKISDLEFQISQLEDSLIVSKNKLHTGNILIDSLKNIKIHNIISLKDLVSKSTFSRKNIIGTWDMETLALSKQSEYIDFDDIYSYERDNNKLKYDADESVIKNLTFMDPNIAIIELIDGDKMSCLFEVVKDEKSNYKKNINVKFVDTDREELLITISEYGGVYIFNYNFNSLKNFFDRDDYDNNTNNFRISGVRYEDDWQVFDNYNIDVIGVFK